jgi:hypothetical protein
MPADGGCGSERLRQGFGTSQRAAILAKNPMLRTFYQRLTDNFDQSAAKPVR